MALGWLVLFDLHVLDVSMVLCFLFDSLPHMCHVGFDSRVRASHYLESFPSLQVEFYEEIETPQVTC